MTTIAKSLGDFLATSGPAALVEVAAAKGSTPRDKGAWMLVAHDSIFGTIGGGQLEYMAIDKARQMLGTPLPSPSWGGSDAEARRGGGRRENSAPLPPTPRLTPLDSLEVRADQPGRAAGLARPSDPHRGEGKVVLDIPLGPEIGQCCGGRVEVAIRLVGPQLKDQLLREAEAGDRSRPHVYVFGGGHVGRALAASLTLLPVKTIVVETRAEELKGLPSDVESLLTAVPEDAVHGAPAGSAFLILTHDHALDFLIAAEALKRTDAAYVGMIGSKTKKATFKSWFLKNADGTEATFARLVSPIGGDAVRDKRPAVIAALAAAEVMTALTLAQARVSLRQSA